MKLLALLIVLSLGSGCGYLADDIHALQRQNDRQQREINELQQRIATVENSITDLIADTVALTGQISAVELSMHAISTQVDENTEEIENLQSLLETLGAQLDAVQEIVNSQVVQLATLQGYTHVYGTIDPCGDGPGYDEVLLKTSAGILVYFESGSARHLSILSPGNYRTTDAQSCYFSVTAGNVIANEHL